MVRVERDQQIAQWWRTYLRQDYREVEARVWLGLDESDTPERLGVPKATSG